MTAASTFPRTVPLLGLALLLSLGSGACARDDSLSVEGSALLQVPGEAETGFDFPERVRLAEEGVAAPADAIAGSCTLGETAAGDPVLRVSLEVPPGTALEGVAMERFSLRLPLEGAERSDAELTLTLAEGGASARSAEGCALRVLYARDGEAGVTVDCAILTPRGVGDVDAELFFAGCR